MSDDRILSDREKIDRAAYHEELRFYKRQQWAVTAAGVALFAGLLTVVRQHHLTPLDRLLATGFIAAGVYYAWFFLDDLQAALGRVRKELDPTDNSPRGADILNLFTAILVGTASVVWWAIIFKLN